MGLLLIRLLISQGPSDVNLTWADTARFTSDWLGCNPGKKGGFTKGTERHRERLGRDLIKTSARPTLGSHFSPCHVFLEQAMMAGHLLFLTTLWKWNWMWWFGQNVLQMRSSIKDRMVEVEWSKVYCNTEFNIPSGLLIFLPVSWAIQVEFGGKTSSGLPFVEVAVTGYYEIDFGEVSLNNW